MEKNEILDKLHDATLGIQNTAEVFADIYKGCAFAESSEDIEDLLMELHTKQKYVAPGQFFWLKMMLEDHMLPYFLNKEEDL